MLLAAAVCALVTFSGPAFLVGVAAAREAAAPAAAPEAAAGGTAPSGVQRGFDVVDYTTGSGSTLERADQAKFPWVKGWISWRKLEPSPGAYAWATGANDLDNILNGAAAYGLQVLLRVDEPPLWATADGSGRPHAVDAAALKGFMQQVAAHVGARARAFQIFNEPNLSSEWGQPVTAAAAARYAALVRAASQGAKLGNPGALVIGAGLASNAGGGAGNMDDLEYLRALYAGGARGAFDALGTHPYGGNSPPAQDPRNCGGICFRRAELQRQVMVDNGDGATPMWATEIGWLHGTTEDLGRYNWMKVSPAQQAEYLDGAFAYAQQHWASWMGPMFVFNLDYSTARWCGGPGGLCYPPTTASYWFAVLNEDRSPRPAYTRLANQAAPAPTPTPTLSPTPLAAATATATPTRAPPGTPAPGATPTATPTGARTATAIAMATPASAPTSPTTSPAATGTPAPDPAQPTPTDASPAPATATPTATVTMPPPTATSTPAPPPPLVYAAALTADGALEIRGTDGTLVRAALALADPDGGRPRFRGWLRSGTGPIFGVAADGRLDWISPEDGAALAEVDWAHVLTIPDDALTSVPLAPPRAGWLLWDYRGSGRLYAVGEDGLLHHIPDLRTFAAQFEWKNVLPASPGQIAQLPVGAPLPPVT